MSSALPRATAGSAPPRHLRLLATLWLPAAVLVGLATLGAVRTAVQSLVVLVTDDVRPWGPAVAVLLVSTLAALVLGHITWRLAVEVPRTVRAWDEALEERRAVRPR
jgi:hypothetical protein